MESLKKTSSPSPRVAVVGCGAWGKNHVRVFKELDALAAVSDADMRRATEIGGAADVPALSSEQILQDPSIHGVVIATPPSTHAKLAQTCLETGKHVLVEKPLSLRLEDARSLSRLSEKSAGHLMVGHLMRYHPAFNRLHEMCREGRFGKIQYIYSNRLHLGRFRKEEDSLWSFAPHDVSMILALLSAGVRRVMATGNAYITPNVNDVTTTHMEFSTGEAAQIFVSWLHPFKEQRLVVVGESGMAVFEDSKPSPDKLRVYYHKVSWVDGIPVPDKADYETVEVEEQEPLRKECEHFLDCIRGNAVPLTDGHESCRVLEILQRADEALRLGHWIEIPGDGA